MKEKDIINSIRNSIKYNVSQKDVAKRLGISETALSRLLSGKTEFTNNLARKMGYEINYKKVK